MTKEIQNIITKIAETKAMRIANQSDLEAVQANKDRLMLAESDLTTQLAEANKPKPKLKSGDIWIDGSYVMYLKEWNFHNRNNSHDRIIDKQCDIMPNFDATYYTGQPIVGNLQDYFDDLKALQENVTEFEVTCSRDGTTKAIFDSIGESENSFRIIIRDKYGSDHRIRMNVDDILKLRQMEATMKRAKK